MSPETSPETFLKARITVSEVLGRQRFNSSILCTFDLYEARTKAAIFKTGERLKGRLNRRSLSEDSMVFFS